MKQRPSFPTISQEIVVLSGISFAFAKLSLIQGQITLALLTRSPLYSPDESEFLVRLACVMYAASVRSEPGSNSSIYFQVPRVCNLTQINSHTIQFPKNNL